MQTNRRMLSALMLLVATSMAQSAVLAQEPFKLGVEQNTQLQPDAGFQGYPAPKMVPQTPVMAPPKHQKLIKSHVEHNVEAPRQPQRPIQAAIQTQAPIQAGIQQAAPPPGVLPQQFLGRWQVMGSRANVQARPEFQSGIENIFSATNSQTWNIVGGGGGGYSMSSDTGVNQVQVGNCTASIAYIRYAHPIKNTVAQEAIVLQLSADGRSFQGKQRISIVKQGESSPRAQVTYNLMGYRQ